MTIRYGRRATSAANFASNNGREKPPSSHESGVLPRVRFLHQDLTVQGSESGTETEMMAHLCESVQISVPASSPSIEAASVRDALDSHIVDDYVTNRVRRALLSLHCEPDHPVLVTEEKILLKSETRLKNHMTTVWPDGIPADKLEEILERLSMLVRIRARTYDDFEPEEQAEATISVLEEGFGRVV